MFSGAFLFFLACLSCINNGESIRCYSYACSNYTTTLLPTCAPPKVITCPRVHNSLIPPDRCMIQRVIGEPGYEGIRASVHHEIRGCANHLKCQSSRLCDEAKKHDNIKHCQSTCCEGDLCNRDAPDVRQVSESRGPTGRNLFCYACSNVTEPGKLPGINCSRPIRQQCGTDPLTGQPQDHCLTIVMSSQVMRADGEVLYQEIRNCSSKHYCGNIFCNEANLTGNLATCKADCCQSSMCNNEGLPIMMATVRPTTAIIKDKFARQGFQTDRPTDEIKPTKAKASRDQFCLKVMLGSLAFTAIFFA